MALNDWQNFVRLSRDHEIDYILKQEWLGHTTLDLLGLTRTPLPSTQWPLTNESPEWPTSIRSGDLDAELRESLHIVSWTLFRRLALGDWVRYIIYREGHVCDFLRKHDQLSDMISAAIQEYPEQHEEYHSIAQVCFLSIVNTCLIRFSITHAAIHSFTRRSAALSSPRTRPA